VQTLSAIPDTPIATRSGRLPAIEITPPHHELNRALDLLREARRPVIVVGHGSRHDMESVLELAEKIGAPILTTFKAKGLVSDHHPLGCGVLGRSGTPIASWFMNESDLLLVFGASFSQHTGIAEYKPTIQVDYDPEGLARFHPVTVSLLGDVGATARLLGEQTEKVPASDPRHEIAQRWAIWKAEKTRRLSDDRGKGINSAVVFDSLSRTADNDAIIAVDVGNNTYSFGRYFECSHQSVVMSGYLGSIGFGMPAAMGAWAAAPDRQILAICGDGGLGQYLAEFTTLVKYQMDITVVVLNNGQLGKISKEQRVAEWDVWQTGLHNPDFAAYAQLCGGYGIRVDSARDLDSAFRAVLDHPGPALVDIVTDPELI